MNEVMVLATKAARGAGAPPSQAAQFGAAAAAHLAAERDVEPLQQALEELPQGPILDIPLRIMAVAEAATEGRGQGSYGAVSAQLMQSYLATLPYRAVLKGGEIEIDLNATSDRVRPQRIALPEGVYAQWSDLAARLLVPESEASRLNGAGAGINDND